MRSSSLHTIKSRSLPMVVEEEIERVILQGEYNPGDRINEMELSLKLGISRGPIREALRSLESSGLVEQIPNRGVFVKQLSAEQVAEIYDVRTFLFALAGRLLANRATDAEIVELRAYVASMDDAIGREDFDVYVKANFSLHEFIITHSGNRTLASQYLSLVKQLRLYRARSLMLGVSMRASNEEHREMVEAISARNPDRAQAAHMNHVVAAKARLMADSTLT